SAVSATLAAVVLAIRLDGNFHGWSSTVYTKSQGHTCSIDPPAGSRRNVQHLDIPGHGGPLPCHRTRYRIRCQGVEQPSTEQQDRSSRRSRYSERRLLFCRRT